MDVSLFFHLIFSRCFPLIILSRMVLQCNVSFELIVIFNSYYLCSCCLVTVFIHLLKDVVAVTIVIDILLLLSLFC